MPERVELVYWDTTIWIAYIQAEKRMNPDEMEGVYESARKIKAKNQNLLTSVFVRMELSDTKMGPDKIAIWHNFCKKRNVFYKDTDLRVGELYTEIIDHYNIINKLSKKEIGPLDAQHLAIAINYNVDAFYTFDSGQKGGISLLSINGNVAGYPLHICLPPPPLQRKLFHVESI
jgi:predicted nucleic acid-binding protein